MLEFFDNSFMTALLAAAGFASVCFSLNVITREYSWVDRLWSIAPVLYAGWFASAAGFENTRVNLMALAVFVWGARLTFNFFRKGGYAKGGEDYRWGALRKRMTPAQFQIFNFFFIAAYQNLLLFLISLPVWVALKSTRIQADVILGNSAALSQRSAAGLGLFDLVALTVCLGFLVLETVADQQQWNFHQLKKQGLTKKRFLDQGLFRFSRHPNFFAEIMQWWMLYLMGSWAAGTLMNVGVVGPFLLTLLFVGSTKFTEMLSLEKYPEYGDYLSRTSILVPWIPASQTAPAPAIE
jgi:steroid 5-alpha reductase family enzyme